MRQLPRLITAAVSIAGAVTGDPTAAEPALTAMPPDLETRFALSALPPSLRDGASVHLLDPRTGYRLARKGTSGISCLVERTAWELADHRDDIYIPLCYDAAGARTYLRVKIDAAKFRAAGLGAADLKKKIEHRYAVKFYRAPSRPGLSYMLSPVMRTVGPPDLQVRTMTMPHVMFYAPGLSNGDIGASPRLDDFSSLAIPFVDRQGNAEQSYIIQLYGTAEVAKILQQEKSLVDDLCGYRPILCLNAHKH
jgi:hypothetical protein